MKLIARWLIVAFLFLLSAYVVPGIYVESFYIALILALFWGLVGISLRPLLILLTLPITLITFGLFTFVINAFLLWLLSTFIEGFDVDGFLSAFLGALIISAGSWISNKLLSQSD